MSLRSRLFALTYDRQLARVEKAGLGELRAGIVGGASGRVLEIGAGTGANLVHYSREVESLTLTEPDQPMLRRLQRKVREQAPLATIVRAPAEELPFEDGSFDAAVSTLVLCGVDDQTRALLELRRVLRPGGRLLFLEHVRAEQARLARAQDRLNRLNRFVAGCDCNRATLASIRAAGYDVTELTTTTMPKAPPFVRPLIVGTAVPGAAAE